MVTKVLIVDDSLLLRQKVAACFNPENYTVFQSENAQSALDLLRTEQDIALMILDVNMPGPNGLQLLKYLYEKKIAPNLYILMLTVDLVPEMRETLKTYGVKAWIIKPFKEKVLKFVIEKIMVSR
jgi:two-component system chemotaxis response regulator CheY